MNNRYERRSDAQTNEYETRQPQQWDDRSSNQAGESMTEYERNEYTHPGDYRRNDHDLTRSDNREMTQQRGRGDRGGYGRREYDDIPAGYVPGRYDDRQPGGYGRFTSESYGGRDFTAPRSIPDYGFAAGYGYPGATAAGGYAADRRGGYDHDDRRPFLERAGDEIASWFGDEDATRRREMDHRGNGPQGYKRSDERILEDVCDHLTEDRYVDARNVTVSVNDREVTLDGTVPSKAAKRRAEDCVDRVTGIGHIQNNLRVEEQRHEERTYETNLNQQTASIE